MRGSFSGLFCAVLLVSCCSVLSAQNLTTPRVSPHAILMQRIGLVDITVDYHRPAVLDRKIWGALVPYGMSPGVPFGSGDAFPWRAGANENTTITFSAEVMVEGKKLAAGTYGLHMIPSETTWEIVFSKDSGAWGSFFYNPARDELRVTVTPVAAAHQEWLVYNVDDLSANSGVLFLHWEKLKVPIKLEVDAQGVTLASMRRELTNTPGFGWQGPLQAANYCLQNNINHQEALQWAERSITNQRNVNNLGVKAGLLEQLGKSTEADKVRAEALAFAEQSGQEADMNTVGYMFMQANKFDRAISVFRTNVKKHPDAWNVYDSLADGLDQKGNNKEAIKYYKMALEKAPAPQKSRIEGILERLMQGS